MQSFLPALALVLTLSFTSSSLGYGLCDLLGCPKQPCGCACEADCCCEPACGYDSCCCEVGCACEPACGCGTGCCLDGRQFAGQRYTCDCNSYVPWCPCKGPHCCDTGGCGACCEPACGCGVECGCEVGCACEPACGCSSCCEPCCPKPRTCCLKYCGFCAPYYCIVKTLSDSCCSGCGCDGEVYWSEWHNDPPQCCDPCDHYGNWIGPSSSSYRAPYAHAYSPGAYAGTGVQQTSYVKSNAPVRHTVARQPVQNTRTKTPVARNRGAANIEIRR